MGKCVVKGLGGGSTKKGGVTVSISHEGLQDQVQRYPRQEGSRKRDNEKERQMWSCLQRSCLIRGSLNRVARVRSFGMMSRELKERGMKRRVLTLERIIRAVIRS